MLFFPKLECILMRRKQCSPHHWGAENALQSRSWLNFTTCFKRRLRVFVDWLFHPCHTSNAFAFLSNFTWLTLWLPCDAFVPTMKFPCIRGRSFQTSFQMRRQVGNVQMPWCARMCAHFWQVMGQYGWQCLPIQSHNSFLVGCVSTCF